MGGSFAIFGHLIAQLSISAREKRRIRILEFEELLIAYEPLDLRLGEFQYIYDAWEKYPGSDTSKNSLMKLRDNQHNNFLDYRRCYQLLNLKFSDEIRGEFDAAISAANEMNTPIQADELCPEKLRIAADLSSSFIKMIRTNRVLAREQSIVWLMFHDYEDIS